MTGKEKDKNWQFFFFFTLGLDETIGSLEITLEICSSSHQGTCLVLHVKRES